MKRSEVGWQPLSEMSNSILTMLTNATREAFVQRPAKSKQPETQFVDSRAYLLSNV